MSYGDNNEYKSGYESGGHQEGNSQSSYGNDRGYQNSGNTSGGYRPRNDNPYRQGPQGQPRNFSNFRGGPRRNGNQEPRDFTVNPPILCRPYAVLAVKEMSDEIAQRARDIRNLLDANEFTARTNGGDGLPAIFLDAKYKELILPWRNFAGHESKLTFSSEEAKWFAEKYQGPGFHELKDTIKGILAGNVRILCGQNLKAPAMFLLTNSRDGAEDAQSTSRDTGNAKFAIDIASDLRIPIFNLARQDVKERIIRQFRLKVPV